MPRVGIEPIRRQQLIDAALAVIEQEGFAGATISKISGASGLSVGIVSHYFGGKQGLLEATMRYLLASLQGDLLQRLAARNGDHHTRLNAIIDANFSGSQVDLKAAKAWLAFWAQAMHSPELARLQRVNERRLLSNLMYSLRRLLPGHRVKETAQTIAALIDGFWLRAALSEGRLDPQQAVDMCRQYLDQTLSAYREVSA